MTETTGVIPSCVLADLSRHRAWQAGQVWRYELPNGHQLVFTLDADANMMKPHMQLPGLGNCVLTPLGNVEAGGRALAAFEMVCDGANVNGV